MERSSVAAGLNLHLGAAGNGQGAIRRHGDVALEIPVHRSNTVEHVLRELDGRDRLGSQESRRFRQASVVHVFGIILHAA